MSIIIFLMDASNQNMTRKKMEGVLVIFYYKIILMCMSITLKKLIPLILFFDEQLFIRYFTHHYEYNSDIPLTSPMILLINVMINDFYASMKTINKGIRVDILYTVHLILGRIKYSNVLSLFSYFLVYFFFNIATLLDLTLSTRLFILYGNYFWLSGNFVKCLLRRKVYIYIQYFSLLK